MEGNELTVSFTLRPWFYTFIQRLAAAAKQATAAGAPVGVAYEGCDAAISAVVAEAIVIPLKGQGGQNPSTISS